jgi:hypothetical protein
MGFDLGGLADMAKGALGKGFAEKAGDFLKSHGMEYLERLVNPKTDEDKAFQAKVVEFGKGMSVNIMNILSKRNANTLMNPTNEEEKKDQSDILSVIGKYIAQNGVKL